jgi:hypothetical protein
VIHTNISSNSIRFFGVDAITQPISDLVDKVCARFGLEVLHWEGNNDQEWIEVVFNRDVSDVPGVDSNDETEIDRLYDEYSDFIEGESNA